MKFRSVLYLASALVLGLACSVALTACMESVQQPAVVDCEHSVLVLPADVEQRIADLEAKLTTAPVGCSTVEKCELQELVRDLQKRLPTLEEFVRAAPEKACVIGGVLAGLEQRIDENQECVFRHIEHLEAEIESLRNDVEKLAKPEKKPCPHSH